MAEDSGRAFANLSEMRMQPSPMMSPEQAAAYRTIMLNSSLKPSNSPVTANLQGAYSSGPRGSQLMLDPSMSANLGDALTVGGGYRTGPMGGAHGRAEIKLPAGLRALLEGSKSGQRTAVSAPVAGGELSATLARMAGQGGMPAQMQGRVGYRTPFAEGGEANADQLPPEFADQEVSLNEKDLTPQQRNGLEYSRRMMESGKPIVNSDGSVTSFMGSIMDAPEGGYINFPTFWDGKVLPPREAYKRALDYEKKTGKPFARYPSIEDAEAGEQFVHKFMELDSVKFRKKNGKAEGGRPELSAEQDESLIDMATRYGQGVMRKHPVITRGLASIATDPLDLVQWLATHGVDPEIAAKMTREEMQDYQKAASSIPNSSELANKYLTQAGVRESETLPEQIAELGISMLGPAMLTKAPFEVAKGAFSWGAKILKKASPSKATALTTDAFHGTRYDFPAFVNEPDKVVRGAKNGPVVLDQALGTHFAKDPKVSNTFVEDIEGGRVIPAKIPDERTFLEAKQDLLPYITDRSTPRSPSNVHSDQDTIQKMIAVEGYKLRPDLLTRYLVQARKLPEDVAASISQRLVKGKSVPRKEFDISTDVGIGPPTGASEKSPWKINKEKKVNLEQFLGNYGGNPYNPKDRAALVEAARKSWQDKGYTGIKYMNTSPRETEFAKDPTSYIVFDPKHTRSRFAKFDPADAESSDLLKSHGGPVHMGKGGLLKAGAEELAELAAKYLPKAEIDQNILNANEFKDLALKGRLHMARTLDEDIQDLKANKMEATHHDFSGADESATIDYESGDFTQRMKNFGFYVDDDKYGNVYFGKNKDAVTRLKQAKSPADYGKASGYSDADIARFYAERLGGVSENAFQKYHRDMSRTAHKPKLKSHGGPIRKASGGLSRVNEAGN